MVGFAQARSPSTDIRVLLPSAPIIRNVIGAQVHFDGLHRLEKQAHRTAA